MLNRRGIQFSLKMVVLMAVFADSAVLVPFYGFNGDTIESDGELTDSSIESGEQLVRLARYQPTFIEAEDISAEEDQIDDADLSVEASELQAGDGLPYYPFEYLVVPQQGVRVARHDGHGGAPGHTHTAAELAAIQQQQQAAAAAASAYSPVKPAGTRAVRHDGHGAAPGHTHTAAELVEIQKQQDATKAATANAGGRPVAVVAAAPTKQ